MHIAEVTHRWGNDFHFKAYCRHCGAISHHGDGYADSYYQRQVFPARHCDDCGCNEAGEKSSVGPDSNAGTLAAGDGNEGRGEPRPDRGNCL